MGLWNYKLIDFGATDWNSEVPDSWVLDLHSDENSRFRNCKIMGSGAVNLWALESPICRSEILNHWAYGQFLREILVPVSHQISNKFMAIFIRHFVGILPVSH